MTHDAWLERRRDWVGEQKRSGVEGVFRATAVHLPLPPSLHDALRVPSAERAVVALVAGCADAGRSLADAARIAEACGASALAVVPDESGRGEGYAEILALAQTTPLPILCHDVVVDPVQVVMARAHGAAAVTLSATLLPDRELRLLYREAVDLGLEVVITTNSAQDVERARGVRLGSADQSGARIIAVTGDLAAFTRVAPTLPDYVVRLAFLEDAGIDLDRLDALGYEAFAAPPTSCDADDLSAVLSALTGGAPD